MMQTAKQTAVASSIGVDPVLLGIVLVVALASADLLRETGDAS